MSGQKGQRFLTFYCYRSIEREGEVQQKRLDSIQCASLLLEGFRFICGDLVRSSSLSEPAGVHFVGPWTSIVLKNYINISTSRAEESERMRHFSIREMGRERREEKKYVLTTLKDQLVSNVIRIKIT